MNQEWWDGTTPLHHASYWKTDVQCRDRDEVQKECIDLLIKAGAMLDPVDIYGNTPLCLAIKHNNVEAVKVLVKAGADLNVTGRGDHSPLEVVEQIRSRNEQIAQILFEAEIDDTANPTMRP